MREDLSDKSLAMHLRSSLKAEDQKQEANQDDRYTTNVITISQKSHINPTVNIENPLLKFIPM